MKVYLLKDVERVGMAGEMIKVKEGFALNFLFPKKLAVAITLQNEAELSKKILQIEQRKEVISSKTSMLAEKMKNITLTLKRKMHDDGKLYGAVSGQEVAELLAVEGIAVSKSQVKFVKSIKEKGLFDVTIKLTSNLQPVVKIKIVPEHATV